MGWFSKSEPGFFLSTVVPQSDSARIAQMLGVVNGEAIIGANIFRDLFSSVRDVVGGRAGGYERALSGARDAAMQDMIEAAREMAMGNADDVAKGSDPKRETVDVKATLDSVFPDFRQERAGKLASSSLTEYERIGPRRLPRSSVRR
jgi:uncharacterized protein YbjQ (UPF0145 family)